jgi:UDP-3-O-[3-hydroxymyristoyl] glucosamine N-acyltransferase
VNAHHSDFAANADQVDGNADGYGDACADPTATLGTNVVLGRWVTVSAGAVIGDDVVLHRRAYIGVDAEVGDSAVISRRLDDAHEVLGPARVDAFAVVAFRGVVAGGASMGVSASSRGQLGLGASLAEGAVLGNGTVGALTQVGASSVVRGSVGGQSVLGDGVSTGFRSVIGHRVTLHDGVRIGARARVGDDSVLGEGAVVGPHAELESGVRMGADSRVRRSSLVGSGTSIGESTVLRSRTQIPAGTVLLGGTITGPGLVTTGGSEVCMDGRDNDADSLVDCADIDCAEHFACSIELRCSDGVDDDYDGQIDCADRDCSGLQACPGEADCTDGIDNSGTTDCADLSCMGAPGCEAEVLCGDELDNDGDGYADADDPDCGQMREWCTVRGGYDQDRDGLVNVFDPDCATLYDGEVCNNGVDDNENGLVDCEDAGCAASPLCVEDCVDGVDNDGDGDADCLDTDCTNEVCLAERRIPEGDVDLTNYSGRTTDVSGAYGGGCSAPPTREDWANNTAYVDIGFDLPVQVTLRVPTSMGGMSSSTCDVQRGGGTAWGHNNAWGGGPIPVVSRLAVTGHRQGTRDDERWASADCNWPQQAVHAAGFWLGPNSRFVRDVDGQPLGVEGAGQWDFGVPTIWNSQSSSDTETFDSDPNCVGLTTRSRRSQAADWTLLAQTHSFRP